MKNLLKGFEALSQVFLFGFLSLMLLALSQGNMQAAVELMIVSCIFITSTAWSMTAQYESWKKRKGFK
tara:strand:+ start:631 stop:834 length:204 start_codon:yes stop_codon:yes gene_type:complete